LPDLVADGVEVIPLSPRDTHAACNRIVELVKNDRLRHTGQAELNAAVLRARQRPSGDTFRWTRHGPDITPLYAAALAVWQVASPSVAPKSTLSF